MAVSIYGKNQIIKFLIHSLTSSNAIVILFDRCLLLLGERNIHTQLWATPRAKLIFPRYLMKKGDDLSDDLFNDGC